ncbi:hypothetical protein [Mariniplasma anaerobium]|uniref:Uncharacterized protein n=1 Tax=Mariniplasma anaerobium TaxID=2735436 RepID=A0A7U9XUV3_9MOLU|nr:hypothetical protein [Mariniplasma anaerobium]BCR35312.1 hypothetical protein MPAN_002050 [Mariniplasma anaerobium]
MKLNAKIYKQLTNEPFEKQVIDGRNVEFHHMDDTPYLTQYAGRGRFAVWTSDGNDYKVLIESTYYDALKPFYEYEVNVIWLGFLDKVSSLSKKINNFFIIPTLALYAIGAILAILFFQDQTLPILLGLIVLVVISNIVQSKVVNKKVRAENIATQDKIRDYLGQEDFDLLVKAQEEHYQKYFSFEEQPIDGETVEVDEVEIVELEEDDSKNGDLNDGK